MRIFFEHNLIGSPANFVWDDGNIVINDTAPCDWRFESAGKRKGSIRAAAEASGCNLLLDPNVPQTQFWKRHIQHPAWSSILSRAQFSTHLRMQVENVLNFITDPANTYFLTHFQIQQSLIDSLQSGRVRDNSMLDHGFLPDDHGFVTVPGYDNAHSATGRMSIVSGPKILTLPKEQRRHLTSRWDDGVLIEVDFNALEARVINWIAKNDTIVTDMYTWIGEKVGTGTVERSVIKEATLAAIYGMSRRNFALRYQDMPDAIEVYEAVRKLLKVQELDLHLRNMSPLTNAFGRKLPETTAKISYHVQSSAVDIACHGFWWLVSQIEKEFAVPVYIIHDALVLDVRKCYVERLTEICKAGLYIDIMNCNLPIKLRSFNHE